MTETTLERNTFYRNIFLYINIKNIRENRKEIKESRTPKGKA